MRRTHALLAALLLALGLGACRMPEPFVPPPVPTPTPGPVEPQPTPAPTDVVTPEEFASIAMGASEASVRAALGAPMRVVANTGEGVNVLLYRARTAQDPTRFAEFWIRGGVVVNKVVY